MAGRLLDIDSLGLPELGDMLPDGMDAAESPEEPAKASHGRASVSTITSHARYMVRRAASETALRAQLPWHWQMGECHHILSQGDVDSLTFLRVGIEQEALDYCLLSTWCMGLEDAEEVAGWVRRGLIGRVDFYVGEIFTGSYGAVFDACSAIARAAGGRVAVFRNHSKVMVGIGRRLRYVITSSANVNTNPRCEQTVITLDEGVATFYKDFYDGIHPFNRDFDDWEAWRG